MYIYIYTYIHTYVYIYIHILYDMMCRSSYTCVEKWEVILGIRLPGTTFWRSSSNNQDATARMHSV